MISLIGYVFFWKDYQIMKYRICIIVCYMKPIHTCLRIMAPKVNAINAREKTSGNKIFFTFTKHVILRNLLRNMFAVGYRLYNKQI